MNDDRMLLIMCCYMPSMKKVNDDFVDACADLQGVIQKYEHDDLIIAGDWNTDFDRSTAQSKYLKEVMSFINVKCSWDHANSVKEDTFYSFNGNGSSCIDYFLLEDKIFSDLITSVVL